MNYGGFNKEARDTARIKDLKTISSLLENELSLGKTLPEPEGDLGTEEIGGENFRLGTFSGEQIESTFRNKLSALPEDPKADGTKYIYALNEEGNRYFLIAVLDDGKNHYIANFLDSRGILANKKILANNPTTSHPGVDNLPKIDRPKDSDENSGGNNNTKVTKKYIDDCFNYSERDTRVMIQQFLSSCGETDIIIPENINGKPVTQILDGAFEDSDITSVSLPNTITSIGNRAFKGVPLTGDLNLPNLTFLGTEAFFGGQFTNINFPKLKTIKKDALKGNNKLNSLTLGLNNVTDRFFESNGLTGTINLPNVTSIGNNAFKNNQLTSINIPNLTSIGEYAFSDNKLTSLNLQNITTIGKGSFYNNKLTNINIPNLRNVGDSAFLKNQLTNLNHQNIETIGASAFAENRIEDLYLPSVTSIGKKAFSDNQLTRLTQEKIPLITEIQDVTFANNRIREVILPKVTKLGNDNRRKATDSDIDILLLEEGYYYSEELVFYNNPLEYISFEKLEEVKDNEFKIGTITRIDLPNVRKIGVGAFSQNKLTSVSLPNLTSLGEGAFMNNKITRIDLPNLISAGNGAFLTNCLNNETVNFLNIPKLENNPKAFVNNVGLKEFNLFGERFSFEHPLKVVGNIHYFLEQRDDYLDDLEISYYDYENNREISKIMDYRNKNFYNSLSENGRKLIKLIMIPNSHFFIDSRCS